MMSYCVAGIGARVTVEAIVTEAVRFERGGDTWTITLTREEKRNALSQAMVEELLSFVATAARERPRVLVLQGHGPTFCAGFDFTGLNDQSDGDLLLRFVRVEMLLQALSALPCLTVAFAHGRCFGAGVDLFTACKVRFAEPKTTFRMPGLSFGLLLGTRRFGEVVGTETAMALLDGSRTFDVSIALDIGLVHNVVCLENRSDLTEAVHRRALGLTADARATLYEALMPANQLHVDMALLVRSASQPGLKQRITEYLKTGTLPT